MDHERILQTVDDFLDLLEEDLAHTESGLPHDDHTQRIRGMLPAIRTIAQRFGINQSLAQHSMMGGWGWFPVRSAAQELRGAVAMKADVDAMLGPQGPQLSASTLHGVVWGSAAPLWDGGHRREAVQLSATAVEKHAQATIGRDDISGSELWEQGFSTGQASPSAPRFRFREYAPGTDSWKNAHLGAMDFAKGCTARIRNLTSHEVDQLDEPVALEYLAALSALARWVDQAEVDRG